MSWRPPSLASFPTHPPLPGNPRAIPGSTDSRPSLRTDSRRKQRTFPQSSGWRKGWSETSLVNSRPPPAQGAPPPSRQLPWGAQTRGAALRLHPNQLIPSSQQPHTTRGDQNRDSSPAGPVLTPHLAWGHRTDQPFALETWRGWNWARLGAGREGGRKKEGGGRVPSPGSQSPDGLHPVLAPQPPGTWEQEALCGWQGPAQVAGVGLTEDLVPLPGRFQTGQRRLWRVERTRAVSRGTRTATSRRGCPHCLSTAVWSRSKLCQAGRVGRGRHSCLPRPGH